jgi:hypothetical protein
MKSKHAIPTMIALAAIMGVAFSPMVLAVEEMSVDAVQNIPAVDTTDRSPEIQFRGGTDGWAIIGGQAHEAEIGINGNAVRADNGVWKVKSEGEISIGDRHAKLELKGKAVDGKIKLQGNGTLESGEAFRIILRGHYVPLFDEQGSFVMAFTTAKIHFMGNGVPIPLIQSGIVNVEAVNPTTDDYNKFLEEFTKQ